jgi:glutathione S-transferase
MILVGMLDSPYVRRVAVSLKLMGLPFEHQSVSVFRHFERFQSINPVVKAPSFVCDDGTVLMDSTLILDYVETLVPAEKRLMPAAGKARLEGLRRIGIALAAADKCVSIVYEKERRAVIDKPWMDRVTAQANTAFGLLEALGPGMRKPSSNGADDLFALQNDPNASARFDAADVAIACAWRFSQYYDATEIAAQRYPNLVAFSARAEQLPEFVSTPLD